MRTDDAHLADQAMALLQSEEGFEWRITVTADQLAQADYAMEKEDRIELLTTASGYMEKGAGLIQMMPQAAPLVVGLLKWAVSGFRGARDIEGMLDRQLDMLLKQPPEQKPDPEQAKAEMEMKTAQQKAQLDSQSKQQDMAIKKQMAQMDMQMKQMDLMFKEKELQFKERELTMNQQFDEAEQARKERTAVMEQLLTLKSQQDQHQQAQEFQQQEHQQAQEHQQQDHTLKLTQAKQQAKQQAAAKRTLQ
jgi:hypothetical protein